MKKQAIFPVLTMLLVSALALISASFAWFTVANTASVSQFSATAQNSDVQLMISQDASFYTTEKLTLDKTKSGILVPDTLYQVSSGAKLSDVDEATGLLKFFDSKLVGIDAGISKIKTYADASVKNVNGQVAKNTEAFTAGTAVYGEAEKANDATYIVFDLYMKVSYDCALYLYDGSYVSDSSTNAGETTQVQNAMRVAFVNIGNVANTSDSLTDAAQIAAAAALDTANCIAKVGAASCFLWQPGNAGNAYGVINAYNTASFAAYSAFTDTVSDPNVVVTAPQSGSQSSSIIVGSNKVVTEKSAIASLITGYNKIRVYIWLEGQDTDCIDITGHSVAGQNIYCTLNFYAKKTA